jgi:hypothetical protein
MLIDLAVFPFTHRQRFTGWAIPLLACPTLTIWRQVPAYLPVLASSPGASVYIILPIGTAIRPMLIDLAVFPFTHRQRFTGWAIPLLACPTLTIWRQVPAYLPVLASSPGASVYIILAIGTAIRPMLIDLAVFSFTHRQRFTGWAISTTSMPNASLVPASACSLAGMCFKPRCISLYYLCRDLSLW